MSNLPLGCRKKCQPLENRVTQRTRKGHGGEFSRGPDHVRGGPSEDRLCDQKDMVNISQGGGWAGSRCRSPCGFLPSPTRQSPRAYASVGLILHLGIKRAPGLVELKR